MTGTVSTKERKQYIIPKKSNTRRNSGRPRLAAAGRCECRPRGFSNLQFIHKDYSMFFRSAASFPALALFCAPFSPPMPTREGRGHGRELGEGKLILSSKGKKRRTSARLPRMAQTLDGKLLNWRTSRRVSTWW